jgi:hypothetical protein
LNRLWVSTFHNFKGGEKMKKKILMLVAALTLTAGIGFGVNKINDKSNDQAGNPPVGAFAPTTDVADGGFTTMGNPPVGA